MTPKFPAARFALCLSMDQPGPKLMPRRHSWLHNTLPNNVCQQVAVITTLRLTPQRLHPVAKVCQGGEALTITPECSTVARISTRAIVSGVEDMPCRGVPRCAVRPAHHTERHSLAWLAPKGRGRSAPSADAVAEGGSAMVMTHKPPTLVVLQLTGGNDPLNTLVPHGAEHSRHRIQIYERV
jgi:hypothetical protein